MKETCYCSQPRDVPASDSQSLDSSEREGEAESEQSSLFSGLLLLMLPLGGDGTVNGTAAPQARTSSVRRRALSFENGGSPDVHNLLCSLQS